MSDKTKKLGAVRLYNAILQNNAGMVTMYVLALSNGSEVQGIDPERVYECWKQAGCNGEMLGALMTYQPLRTLNNRRSRGFNFVSSVSNVLRRELISPTPSDKALLLVHAGVKAFDQQGIESAIDPTPLREALVAHREWPYPIMALSKGLASRLLVSTTYPSDVQAEVVDWYIDMHGAVQIDNVDFSPLLANDAGAALLRKLAPDTKSLKKIFEGWPMNSKLQQARNGYQLYKVLQPRFPELFE